MKEEDEEVGRVKRKMKGKTKGKGMEERRYSELGGGGVGVDLETWGQERTERQERSINCGRDDEVLEIYERGRPTERTAGWTRVREGERDSGRMLLKSITVSLKYCWFSLFAPVILTLAYRLLSLTGESEKKLNASEPNTSSEETLPLKQSFVFWYVPSLGLAWNMTSWTHMPDKHRCFLSVTSSYSLEPPFCSFRWNLIIKSHHKVH